MDLNSVKYREKFENYEIYPPPPSPGEKLIQTTGRFKKSRVREISILP